ncbi:MAG: SH3 domain-containing protein [Chloroflexi bacterium]|nr:SH3 domain-containing protein [Chloroflexota bacterium]
MKVRFLIASMALFVLVGLAIAQEYCVRANRRINLRDVASLQGAWLETVPPGTTLTVIGEQNRWLKISRNGSEVWMASWVDYSRLDNCGGTGSQPGLSAGTANIDNCCFVDRQCLTDQDWTAGYHAFQDNQCPAPGQTGAPRPSQPISGAPAQIDNCCFVDRQCTNALEWAAGYHAFQNNQCPAPGQTGAPSLSQPVGGTPAQIDNCCFVDRQCTTELDWMGGWHAFRNNQCAAPAGAGASESAQSASGQILRTANGIVVGHTSGRRILPSTSVTRMPTLGETLSIESCCQLNWQCNSDQDRAEGYRALAYENNCALPGRVLSIVGDAEFIDFIVQRLDELRNRLPHRYDYVFSGLDKIEQAPPDLFSGFGDTTGRILFAPIGKPPPNDWHKRWSAALVHEACHMHRYAAGLHVDLNVCNPESIITEEVACREMELQVMIELDAAPHVIEWARGMVADTRAGIGFEAPAWC